MPGALREIHNTRPATLLSTVFLLYHHNVPKRKGMFTSLVPLWKLERNGWLRFQVPEGGKKPAISSGAARVCATRSRETLC